MPVSEFAIENEVLKLFADCGITAGDFLPFRRLRADWPRTSLRSSDLVLGVKRLIFSGDLELEDDHEGGLFILTPQGYKRAAALPKASRTSWTGFVAKALDKLSVGKPSTKKARRPPALPMRHS